MFRFLIPLALFGTLLPAYQAVGPVERAGDQYWPAWRGPDGTGSAPGANPPVEWSEEKNIRWKVPVPGQGSATPIVWKDRVFVVSAVPVGEARRPAEEPQAGGRRGPRNVEPDRVHQFTVFAFDRASGRQLWKRIVHEELPHESHHPTGTYASPSPITDGERLYAFFGSRGLYCLDLDGNLIWEKDLGDMTIRLGFGEGASPALAGDRLLVTWDHQGPSFIVALDKRTGAEIWRTERDEITSWSSPLVVQVGSRQQVVTSATGRVRSYDVATGKLVWEAEGMTLNTIPTPVAGGGLVFLTSGFRGNALLAVDLARAQGDITNSEAIVWRHDRDTPYTPSPLLYKDVLYFLKSNNGILSAFEAGTGQPVFATRRLDGVRNVYASPVGAADRIYIAGREGETTVLSHGPDPQTLSVNRLDDGFDASPAVVDGELYLRGRSLYCIAEN